jgi:hypothetical protein
MNPIVKSIRNFTSTANGAPTLKSTGSSCVDLFSKVGSARQVNENDIVNMFYNAAMEDIDVATRIMLWARDCRGGAGERRAYRIMLKEFETWCMANTNGMEVMQTVVNKTVELGRWDDLFVLDSFFELVIQKIAAQINTGDIGLLAKWLPREKSANKAVAFRLMKGLGMTPKQYRKFCSGVITTETLMCAKKWEDINLSHVPSVASARYQKAFEKQHPGYYDWKSGLESGVTKVNVSVSYPYDVYRTFKSDASREVINAQWDALPNYIKEGVSILPVVDVSGSMSCQASGGLSCMDISISLGAYIASKNTGPFAKGMITFHENPTFYFMKYGIYDEFSNIKNLPWGGSTNFEATYKLILKHAKSVNASQEDMPKYLIVLSDMQFNMAEGRYGHGHTNFEAMEKTFAEAGYKMPQMIFWNLNAAYGRDAQVGANQPGVSMVSGFSPSILKVVLSGEEYTPIRAMMDTVMVDRYKVLETD